MRARAALLLSVAIAAAALALVACGAPATGPTAAPAKPGASSVADVQRFNVDLSTGAYVPAVIEASAGAPIEITFGQGSGCLGTLVFPSFRIEADMTQGPRTFDLGVVAPGEYQWACGMDMVFGTLRVK